MESIVGIFNSLTDAKRGATILESLGIPRKRISVLSPGTTEGDLEGRVQTTETEQSGMGSALGATIGGAMGVAGGFSAGAVAAGILVPGVGPVIAFGLLGAALLGTGGAAAGSLAGEALEEGIYKGLPHDELFVYEDALRRGRSLVIALAETPELAERARAELLNAGAESIDTARHEWWIGLRDAEEEHYLKQGGDFKLDEAIYRLGFEAALHPLRRNQPYEQVANELRQRYGGNAGTDAFRRGYERGQQHQSYIRKSYKKAA
jgi:hypothetical protein